MAIYFLVLLVVMGQDVPAVFEKTVEVEETYLGDNVKKEPHAVKSLHIQSKRGGGTTKQQVFGILCRIGKVSGACIYLIGDNRKRE